jgi:predicted secreted hydrolase
VSGERKISRRTVVGGLALLSLTARVRGQGFAGLSEDAAGFAQVKPGRAFSFPADHGAHPEFRIEWWYVTANLKDTSGAAYGAQWTLFRQALASGTQQEGWANQQIWMAHAAVTRADTHRFNQTYARGGVGQAGVTAEPFAAWIDSWAMRGAGAFNANNISPLALNASATDFSYALQLEADHPLVLQGDGGYSKKSLREQASYYYSQPFFKARGQLTIDDKPVEVSGFAWMDREWSSQPLAPDQKGWDWFALHFAGGEKLMLYRMRQSDGNDYVSGNWIVPARPAHQLGPADIRMTPGTPVDIDGHKLPVTWQVAIPQLELAIQTAALNERAWNGTSFAYWEGPITFKGSHSGVGYLEMTGY